jgi:hypothetical protein
MTAPEATRSHEVGRPKVDIQPEQVGELRDQGMSWRKIGKALAIGTATAMRLFRSISRTHPDIKDLRPETPEPIE